MVPFAVLVRMRVVLDGLGWSRCLEEEPIVARLDDRCVF
jgi:hypothetical protein